MDLARTSASDVRDTRSSPAPAKAMSSDASLRDSALPALVAWIDQERQARVIVTPDAGLVWASAAARVLLEQGRPFWVDEEQRLTGARTPVAERLAQYLAGVDERIRCWILEDSDEAWLVWAQQIRAQGQVYIGLTIRRRGEPLAFTALAEARRLTPAEARIISMMLAGAETGRIAAALDISVETLRTHVKHAYRKLGVTSRGELFVGALPFLQP